jgi:hypothetical protein
LLGAFRSILTSGRTTPEPSARDRFREQRREAIARFDQLNPLKREEPTLGYLEASFLPERFDPGRFTINELRQAAERAHITYTGWPFLFIHSSQPERTYVIQDGWETFVQTTDFGGHYLMDFWRFQQSAFFYHRTILRPSAQQWGEVLVPVAEFRNIAFYVAQAIDCLTRIYDGMFEDSVYMSVDIRMENTSGRSLVSAEPGTAPLIGPHTCRRSLFRDDSRSPSGEPQ